MNKVILMNRDVFDLASQLACRLPLIRKPGPLKAFGIPRGGIPAAYALTACCSHVITTDDLYEADIFIDDIIDSGATLQKWCDEYPGKPFYALIDKTVPGPFQKAWVVFPWEGTAENGITDNIVRLLQYVGEDAGRGGLEETPMRVAKAWKFWCSGYGKDPKDVLKVFEDGADGCDEMVVVKDIPLYSHCEHHMAAIIGTATVAYIPDGKIVGLSKLSRLVDIFARRLQVQERLTNQIADALQDGLQPKGVGVVVKARHLCMESRGVCQQGHHTITSALRGVMRNDASARAEFLSLARD